MNRGFIYYYKEGFKESFKTIKDKDNLLKYLLYMFAKLFSCVLILPRLLFNLSDIKVHKMIRKSNQIDIINSFKETSNPKTLYSVFISVLIKLLIITGGILLIGTIGGVLMLFGLFLGSAVTGFSSYAIYFGIPAFIILAVYLIIFPLYFSPMNYLIQTDDSIKASDAVSLSVSSMKLTGKVTVFLTNLATYLLISLYVGIIALLFYISMSSLEPALEIIFLVLALLVTLAFLFVAPLIIMTKNVALLMLYEDMALDNINLSKNYEGIRVRRFDAKPTSIENSLVEMFDETNDEEAEIEVLKADFTVKRRKAESKIKRPEKQNLDENNDILAEDIEEKVEETEEIYVDTTENEEVIEKSNEDIKVESLSDEVEILEESNDSLDEAKEDINEEEIVSENDDKQEELEDEEVIEEIYEATEKLENEEIVEEKEESITEEIVEEYNDNQSKDDIIIDEEVENEPSDEKEDIKEDESSSNENDELLKQFEEDIEYPKFEDEE